VADRSECKIQKGLDFCEVSFWLKNSTLCIAINLIAMQCGDSRRSEIYVALSIYSHSRNLWIVARFHILSVAPLYERILPK
jgi:hypothetical protein